jgi:hypothetical protein
MKRLIILKTPSYLGTPAERQTAFKEFRAGIKPLTYLTILEEREPDLEYPSVIIEFPDDQVHKMYIDLPKILVVDCIDSYIPINKSQPEPPSSKPPTGKKMLTIDVIKKMSK